MKRKILYLKMALCAFMILLCLLTLTVSIFAITNSKISTFNIGIKYNPKFYIEVYYFCDNNDNFVLDENEQQFLLFKNTNGFCLGENVDLTGDKINLHTVLNHNDNLKFLVINKTPDTEIGAVNISVFLNAINNADTSAAYNISHTHGLGFNQSAVLSGKVSYAGDITYFLEISETFTATANFENIFASNLSFAPEKSFETIFTAANDFNLPEEITVKLLTNAQTLTYTTLEAGNYTYNAATGKLFIDAAALKTLDFSLTSSGASLLMISAIAKPAIVAVTLTITDTQTNTKGFIHFSVYNSSGTQIYSTSINENQTLTLDFTFYTNTEYRFGLDHCYSITSYERLNVGSVTRDCIIDNSGYWLNNVCFTGNAQLVYVSSTSMPGPSN